MGVFDAFFGCIGDGGFTLACISGRRGDGGFTVATWLCPVREKVRPARPDGGREREKVRPAHEKWPKIGGLWRAGRVFSRKHRWRGCVGRTLSRVSPWRPRAGRVFSRKHCRRPRAGRTFSRVSTRRPRAGRTFSRNTAAVGTLRGLAVPSAPAGISPGAPRAPGAWHEPRKAASRRSGSSAPPTRRPLRSSGTWARSRGR